MVSLHDDRVDDAVDAETIEGKTARHIWGEVTFAFKQAATAKPPTQLRVRDDNPANGVQGPTDESEDKEHCVLYPREAQALFACPVVPLDRRRVYAVAILLK